MQYTAGKILLAVGCLLTLAGCRGEGTALPAPGSSVSSSPSAGVSQCREVDFSKSAILEGIGMCRVLVGDSKKHLVQVLGKPDSLHVLSNNDSSQCLAYFSKHSLYAAINKDRVVSLAALAKSAQWPGFSGKTSKGLSIGSSSQEVISAYGEPSLRSFKCLRYENLGIAFSLEGDRTTEILVFEPIVLSAQELGALEVVPGVGAGAVRLGMTNTAVRQSLGQPSKILNQEKDGSSVTYYYQQQNMNLVFDYNVCSAIQILANPQDSSLCYQGKVKGQIGLGSPAYQVSDALGVPESFADGSTYEYWHLGIKFLIENEQVVGIIILRPISSNSYLVK